MSDTESITSSEQADSWENDEFFTLVLCCVEHEQLVQSVILYLLVQVAAIVCVLSMQADHQTAVVNTVEKFLVSLVRNRQNRGALFVMAKAALPHARRCAQKVERPHATINFHPYLLRLGYVAFADRFWLSRMRMNYETFEKLLAIVENADHPLLARQTRTDGNGVRDDVQTCLLSFFACTCHSMMTVVTSDRFDLNNCTHAW
jgi:hypothetical protein